MENEAGSFEEKPRKLLPTKGINRPNSEDFPAKPCCRKSPINNCVTATGSVRCSNQT